jgi:hypothetical protein
VADEESTVRYEADNTTSLCHSGPCSCRRPLLIDRHGSDEGADWVAGSLRVKEGLQEREKKPRFFSAYRAGLESPENPSFPIFASLLSQANQTRKYKYPVVI